MAPPRTAEVSHSGETFVVFGAVRLSDLQRRCCEPSGPTRVPGSARYQIATSGWGRLTDALGFAPHGAVQLAQKLSIWMFENDMIIPYTE